MLKVINEESLNGLFFNCYKNPGYRGAIMFRNEADLTQFVSDLSVIDDNDKIPGVNEVVSASAENGYITFKNDSTINLLTQYNPERIRGRRFNNAIIDGAICDFDAIRYLQDTIVDYSNDYYETRPRRRQRRNDAMDAFARATMLRREMGMEIKQPDKMSVNTNTEININNEMENKINTDNLDDFLGSFKIINS